MKAIITGAGEYRTRDGRKAVVLGRNPNSYDDPWLGYIEELNHSWNNAGRENTRPCDADIIGPWTEPITREAWLIFSEEFTLIGNALERQTALRVARISLPDKWKWILGLCCTEGQDAQIIETIHHGGAE